VQRGGLDNFPIPVSPCEDKLVGMDHIQDFGSAAPRKRVRAQHGQAPITDHFIQTIFIVTKVSPVLLC
jgi:hypothetical protein